MYTLSNEKAHRMMMDHLRNERDCPETVLNVMDKLRRDWFLPVGRDVEHLRPVSIGYGQTMSAPFIVASMTGLLELEGVEKVLEIGSGCGYQTAVLLGLGADVFSIEFVPELAEFGRLNLEKIGHKPRIRSGDGYFGWPEEAPFDRILIAATLPRVPELLIAQLKPGGIMVFPLKKGEKEFMVKLFRRSEADYTLEWLYGVVFVPFVGVIRKSDGKS
jgi:protein-L-isoaspartate(D-aspartate) O-methyltransferase